nr:helix-turn-helix domain-containing protein [Streptomyces smaragdinus]
MPDCPLREVLGLIGDKWSAQVLVGLGDGPHRFTELERAIEGIGRRMLTLSLRNLERNALITCTVHPDAPPRVEYAATLAAWVDRNRPAIAAARHG